MKRIASILTFLLVLVAAKAALAHFGMVIPSEDVVLDRKQAALTLELSFSHPMEGEGMTLEKPGFEVYVDGEVQDISSVLKPATIMGGEAFTATYTVQRPGVYSFVMTPKPYFEPAEDCFIQHLTKVVVPAFGEEEGWEEPLGLATEIVPLTRPFGNYAGNVFTGRVFVDGVPAPGVVVEVEYYNRDGKYEAPNDYLITQVVLTDDNGVFSYAVPWAGWWGFAALTTASEPLQHEGEDKDVEMGAVLWVKFVEPKSAK